VTIDQVINEMAGQTVMLHQDRCTKNYYMHRDTRTNLWSRIPWYINNHDNNNNTKHAYAGTTQ
jgi:spore coat protein CotH